MLAESKSGNNRLNNQVAIVTGGASGIGRATSISLAKEGAKVALVDINQSNIDDVITEIKDSGTGLNTADSIFGMTLNVRSEKDMEEMAARTVEHFGQIDILVHCAAILRVKGSGPKFLYDISMEEWQEVIDTNLRGTFLSNKSVLPSMIKQKGGQIINISSTSGLKGRAFDSVYSASKFGVVGLTESLAEEVRQYGIKVHAIMPDAVDTPMWEQNKPIRAPKYSLAPQRVADLIVYIATLPGDTVLNNLVLLPFRTRRRKKGTKNK